MSSGGEDSSYLEESDLVEAVSKAPQTLPRRRQSSRPSKRRRVSDTSEDDDSIENFIVDDDDTEYNRRSKRRQRSSSRGDFAAEDSEEHVQKKKPKYKIHIPKDPVLPEATIQYGTQLPSNPDSSPYRIRGPKWKLPKVAAPNRQSSMSPKLEKKPHALSPNEESAVDNLGSSNLQVSEKTVQKQISPAVSLERNNVYGPPKPGLGPSTIDIAQELADLPSDAFSSSLERSPSPIGRPIDPPPRPKQSLAAPQTGLRQTTLFGGKAPVEQTPSQTNKVHNYRVDMAPEAPTHHKLDQEALKTWVYPTNLGSIREYQYNIVRSGLFHNMLVALPTGLGKTFIAATIMLNYFRWTRDAKIVFMAPTKPLVSQQVDACFNIVGIPRSTTTMLTGGISPVVRAEEWEGKRVFFMTPQTLDNDLRTGIADPKKIVLLVIDEAHRATGSYSYVNVVSFMRRFSNSFRVLALTATPGSTVDAVQEVIDGLEISKVEIRTEESIDIQQFTHHLKVEQIVLDPSDEMVMIKDLFSKALQPLVDQLCSQNAFYSKDPMSLTPYGLVKAQQTWFMSDTGKRANPGIKGMMRSLFAILSSVAHSVKLLNFHGISPFYSSIKELRNDVEERGAKASKYKKQINDSPPFIQMMDKVREWINNDNFVGHPKLTYLCDAILNHFLDAGEGRLADGAPPSGTRVIVFSEFRDSAEEITRVLNRHGPMIRASVFVGQADSRRSEGMNQAKQQETIRKFKAGAFNVLVATSIGEEGLDIGQVDLIVCYDASGSPIRMLQRMGRTGRKRAGHVILLLMRGKEEDAFKKAKDGYEQMQKMICSGTHFNYRLDLSTRIIPKDVTPVVDKRHIEIPSENTQNQSLPEPKRRASKAKKRPPKKFNMLDGVQTGFRKASRLGHDGDSSEEEILPSETSEEQLMPIPALEDVLLKLEEGKELERRFQSICGDDAQYVSSPEMNHHPVFQRSLGPVKLVQHGQGTKRFVNMIRTMRGVTEFTTKQWQRVYDVEGPMEAKESAASRPPITSSTSSGENSTLEVSHPKTKDRNCRRRTHSRSGDPSDPESSSSHNDDLQDFIVDDNKPLYNRHSTSRRSSSPLDAHHQPTPFFEPSYFAATQDTNDEDLPDLGDLLRSKAARPLLEGIRLEDNARQAMGQRGKRRVIMEEESDE